ncbi:MAG: carboxypeptidase-like regulatory domain-containing protein [Sphingobacteriia bacterium]|nr:MAG: carboxypeptidase-like regulatory domain-containing protein [Sphingobacteriia bacterium]
MKRSVAIIGLLFCAFFSNAQKMLIGNVLAKDSKLPIASASIFLSNTSVGTISKDNGDFVLQPFPEGRFDLVVSMVGYETYSITISSNAIPSKLEILLVPKVKELEEVIVMPYEKNGWEKWGDFFMENLIGKTPNAIDCKLLNKEVVRFRFNKKKNTLNAYADEPLHIQNEALGYELKYDLSIFEFNYSTRVFFYQGYPLFSDLSTKRKRIETKWQKNREETYNGSIMHFMRSLYRNTLETEGYELRKIIRNNEKKNNLFSNSNNNLDILIDKPLNGDSIAYAIDSFTVGLQFNNYLQVVYKWKYMPESYRLTQRGMPPKQPMTAEIYMPDSEKVVAVLANGSYFSGKDVLALGFWAWSEKLSNLLPLDYRPPKKK